jgi:hypothetical protein
VTLRLSEDEARTLLRVLMIATSGRCRDVLRRPVGKKLAAVEERLRKLLEGENDAETK